ncbi:MAG: SPOR domain-containing protein [Cryobacterium sp.]|nr:SPOR domain-containing protein [Oligoflexia bacterium]
MFIYDRKEVGILILLGVGVALFAFTLGVHLGKQVIPKAAEVAGETTAPEPVGVAAEGAPNRQEVSAEVKNIPGAVDETLDQSLRDEIAKTGMQIDKARQVALPEKVRKKSDGPEVGAPANEATAPIAQKLSPNRVKVAVTRLASGGYTLQVGSYPTLRDAEPELVKLNENGLRAEIHEVDLTGKGKWFRLFVGQFESIKDAEKAGKAFRKERRIADFVVVKAPGASATVTE